MDKVAFVTLIVPDVVMEDGVNAPVFAIPVITAFPPTYKPPPIPTPPVTTNAPEVEFAVAVVLLIKFIP